MKINDVELEALDLNDYDNAVKWENALKNIQDLKDRFNTMDISKGSAVILDICTAVKFVFEELYGIDVVHEIFGDRNNMLECMCAIDTLITETNKVDDKMQQLLNKYNIKKVKYENNNRNFAKNNNYRR